MAITVANFSPGLEWERGICTLQIESRLEDLAGNNLDRLFDSDLTQNRRLQKVFIKKYLRSNSHFSPAVFNYYR